MYYVWDHHPPLSYQNYLLKSKVCMDSCNILNVLQITDKCFTQMKNVSVRTFLSLRNRIFIESLGDSEILLSLNKTLYVFKSNEILKESSETFRGEGQGVFEIDIQQRVSREFLRESKCLLDKSVIKYQLILLPPPPNT